MEAHIPAISENEASGAMKELYEDIKAVLRVPMVNLIFRHIATFPGCLEQLWQILRPSYASGEVSRLGRELFAGLNAPAQPLLSPFALRAVGVSAEDEKVIARILDAYNHANSMNLIALNTVLTLMGGGGMLGVGDKEKAPSGESPEEREPQAIPPMLTLEEMDPSARGIVLELMTIRPKEKVPVIASLYRHLAHWPGYMALTITVLSPLSARGVLQSLVEEANSLAGAGAGTLLGRSSTGRVSLSAPREVIDPLEKSMRFFARELIVEMMVIGKILRQILPFSKG